MYIDSYIYVTFYSLNCFDFFVTTTMNQFVIRNLESKDATSLAKNANNLKIWNNVKDYFPYPFTERDAVEFIKRNKLKSPATYFAIAVEGQAVGVIGLVLQNDVYRKNAEIGYWLGEAYWGQGIMTKAIVQFVNSSFKLFDLFRIYAGVFEDNKGSIRVLEKAGFKREAIFEKGAFKNGRYINEHRYVIFDQNKQLESTSIVFKETSN